VLVKNIAHDSQGPIKDGKRKKKREKSKRSKKKDESKRDKNKSEKPNMETRCFSELAL
jgi:hypothetical protein